MMARKSAIAVTPASGSLTIAGARIVFEPMAYDGLPETSRANLVLEASKEEQEVVRAWEKSTEGDKALCSALTPRGLKVKLDKATVRCWEDKKQTAALPEGLNDDARNAILRWCGSWETKNQHSLCLKVTDLEVMEQEIEYPFG